MKFNIPSIDLISQGKIDKIEENYLKEYSNQGEVNLKYLTNWWMYKNILLNKVKNHSGNVKYLTIPYLSLVTKHQKTLSNIYVQEFNRNNKELLNFNGVLISKHFGCILELSGSNHHYTIFEKMTGVPLVSGSVCTNSETEYVEINKTFYLSDIEKSFNDDIIRNLTSMYIFSVMLQKLIDGKDIIIVPPNGKTKTKHEKYVNDNRTGIEVWDSRMFNSYVRLDGFSVSGHFRHQPVGIERRGHKLIWINEFEKHGYNYRRFSKNIN